MGSAVRPPGASVTRLPCHRCRLERLGWPRCTSARSVRHATLATKGAGNAAPFAFVSDPARNALTASNLLLSLTSLKHCQCSRRNLVADGRPQQRLSGQAVRTSLNTSPPSLNPGATRQKDTPASRESLPAQPITTRAHQDPGGGAAQATNAST